MPNSVVFFVVGEKEKVQLCLCYRNCGGLFPKHSFSSLVHRGYLLDIIICLSIPQSFSYQLSVCLAIHPFIIFLSSVIIYLSVYIYHHHHYHFPSLITEWAPTPDDTFHRKVKISQQLACSHMASSSCPSMLITILNLILTFCQTFSELCLLYMDPKSISIFSVAFDFVERVSGRGSLTHFFV